MLLFNLPVLWVQMAFKKYILPLFVSSTVLAQTDAGMFPQFEIGFTHSTFTSMSFQTARPTLLTNKESHAQSKKAKLIEAQFGFGIGFFLWMPLNEGVAFKPKVEGCFSTTCLKQGTSVFATSFDLVISHGFAIALKPADKHGIIYMARDMSCYLTSKQPYLVLGPKLSLRKFDHGYLDKGFQNELGFGFLIGYGINYEFHGTSFSPEIVYHITSTAQNKINDSKKMIHTITLAISFF